LRYHRSTNAFILPFSHAALAWCLKISTTLRLWALFVFAVRLVKW